MQTLIDRGVDYNEVARLSPVVSLTTESFVQVSKSILLREDFDKAMKAFEASGAYIVPNSERDKSRDAIIPSAHMSRDLVEKSVEQACEAASLKVPAGTKVLIVEVEDVKDVLGWKKMFPVLTAYCYDRWEEAVGIGRTNCTRSTWATACSAFRQRQKYRVRQNAY